MYNLEYSDQSIESMKNFIDFYDNIFMYLSQIEII